jgi:hypothetical protein
VVAIRRNRKIPASSLYSHLLQIGQLVTRGLGRNKTLHTQANPEIAPENDACWCYGCGLVPLDTVKRPSLEPLVPIVMGNFWEHWRDAVRAWQLGWEMFSGNSMQTTI